MGTMGVCYTAYTWCRGNTQFAKICCYDDVGEQCYTTDTGYACP